MKARARLSRIGASSNSASILENEKRIGCREPSRIRSRSLNATTCGNTDRKVASSERVDASVMPYRWNHWQTMPSGASRDAAASKNSWVNRLATPVSHGFDGSEMMRSYSASLRRRRTRASPRMSRTRGSSSGRPFSGSKNRDASTTAGSISKASTRSTGCVSTAPTVSPLPQPMTATRFASAAINGKWPSSSWVSRSLSPFDASVLPLILSRRYRSTSCTATVAVAPSR